MRAYYSHKFGLYTKQTNLTGNLLLFITTSLLTDKQVACILKHTALGVCVCMHGECALTVSKSLFGFCVMKGGSQYTKKDLCS